MQLRAATADDLELLTDMLVEAANWSGDQRLTRRQIEAAPGLAHYVAGWPQAHDFGVVAVDEARNPIGAAWARTFAADDPGYGYVASDVPEISMAVVETRRGEGVGRGLLTALVERARDQGWQRVSLSVEDGNRAERLYRRLGFVAVGRNGGSSTMLLDLP